MTKLATVTYRAFDSDGQLIHVGAVDRQGDEVGHEAVVRDATDRFAPRPIKAEATYEGWRVEVGDHRLDSRPWVCEHSYNGKGQCYGCGTLRRRA